MDDRERVLDVVRGAGLGGASEFQLRDALPKLGDGEFADLISDMQESGDIEVSRFGIGDRLYRIYCLPVRLV